MYFVALAYIWTIAVNYLFRFLERHLLMLFITPKKVLQVTQSFDSLKETFDSDNRMKYMKFVTALF